MAFISQIKLSDTTYDISAIKLKNARTIRTNLTSTSTASFDGTANITPGVTGILPITNGGTGANNRKTAITNLGVFGLYSREDIGIAPNFDNPGVNGMFEMRAKTETTGETGTKPFDSYAPFISLRYSNTMFQLAGSNSSGFYVRGKQGTDPTLTGTAWQKFLTSANWSDYAAAKSHSHSYLPLSGGTMTGDITMSGDGTQLLKAGSSTSWITGRDTALVRIPSYNAYNAITSMKTTNGSWEMGVYTNDYMYFTYCSDANYNAGTNSPTIQIKVTPTNGLYGAVWNDYAEFRNQVEEIKPGYCVASMDNGQVYKTTEKFQACDGIVSDTFGFSIGETDECKTPLAVAGRVLAYCEGNRYDYHSGDTVCAGPYGKVCKMTREEIREWPDRIIGIVSEIPEYERWGTCDVLVDGRIWIKVK